MTHLTPPPPTERVLVFGTTSDYVDWIRRARPGGALFLTDRQVRLDAVEPPPDGVEEIVASLDAPVDLLEETVRRHLDSHNITLVGIACFDCERMSAAAEMAARFGLRYPSVKAVRRCRDKSFSKALWHARGVACPRFTVPRSEAEMVELTADWRAPLVLKPRTGSGSELTFCCDGRAESRETFRRITRVLESKRRLPMYRELRDAGPGVIVEEWIAGAEFSCDFLVRSRRTEIVRLTTKHRSKDGPFGTTVAYELVDARRLPFDPALLQRELFRAAKALGIEDAWCMADFIVRDDAPIFLELTPRPGGDCLPWLLRATAGIDILGGLLDFVSGTVSRVRDESLDDGSSRGNGSSRGVGLRLFADRAGTLRRIDTRRLAEDPRVVDVYLRRRAGDRIVLPPRDYDSWILGHAVYIPEPDRSVACQNDELAAMVNLQWR